MTKDELLSQLENAKNNFVLGLAAISLFSSSEIYLILEKNYAQFGQYHIDFSQVSNLLQAPQDRDIAVNEFLKSQMRTLIKESFELIRDYCNETSQFNIFKSESWYQFARMIRNSLSHNFKFEFNDRDKRLLPVTWKNKTITAAMDGQYLKLDFFGYIETWELFLDYQNLALNRVV